MDLASTGSNISKYPIDAAFKKVEVLENNSKDEEKAVSSMKEITMEDFLDDFKL